MQGYAGRPAYAASRATVCIKCPRIQAPPLKHRPLLLKLHLKKLPPFDWVIVIDNIVLIVIFIATEIFIKPTLPANNFFYNGV